jgi:hypothetical protein
VVDVVDDRDELGDDEHDVSMAIDITVATATATAIRAWRRSRSGDTCGGTRADDVVTDSAMHDRIPAIARPPADLTRAGRPPRPADTCCGCPASTDRKTPTSAPTEVMLVEGMAGSTSHPDSCHRRGPRRHGSSPPRRPGESTPPDGSAGPAKTTLAGSNSVSGHRHERPVHWTGATAPSMNWDRTSVLSSPWHPVAGTQGESSDHFRPTTTPTWNFSVGLPRIELATSALSESPGESRPVLSSPVSSRFCWSNGVSGRGHGTG